MISIFKRYWWVPEHSPNVKDVPRILEKAGVEYRVYEVIDMNTREVVGYTYEFSCIPVKYHVLRMAVSGGNNFNPLEFAFVTQK